MCLADSSQEHARQRRLAPDRSVVHGLAGGLVDVLQVAADGSNRLLEDELCNAGGQLSRPFIKQSPSQGSVFLAPCKPGASSLGSLVLLPAVPGPQTVAVLFFGTRNLGYLDLGRITEIMDFGALSTVTAALHQPPCTT